MRAGDIGVGRIADMEQFIGAAVRFLDSDFEQTGIGFFDGMILRKHHEAEDAVKAAFYRIAVPLERMPRV